MRRSSLSAGLLAFTFSLSWVTDAYTPLQAQTETLLSQVNGATIVPTAIDRPSTGRRVALVIGNATYQSGGSLQNPVNDATDMARVLGELGFEVIISVNSTQRQMEEALNRFFAAIQQGSVGVFYYAGHGIQSEGENYLIPVDAQLEVEQDLRYSTVPLGWILDRMQATNNDMNIVILDACRNNPFARRWRSAQRGLATVNAAEGVFIAYATAPGKVADDGTGRNGTFTAALLQYIRTPNQDVEQLFKQVRESVWGRTGGRQITWTASSLLGSFAFSGDRSSGRSSSMPQSNPDFQTIFPPSAPVMPLVPCAGSVCEGPL